MPERYRREYRYPPIPFPAACPLAWRCLARFPHRIQADPYFVRRTGKRTGRRRPITSPLLWNVLTCRLFHRGPFEPGPWHTAMQAVGPCHTKQLTYAHSSPFFDMPLSPSNANTASFAYHFVKQRFIHSTPKNKGGRLCAPLSHGLALLLSKLTLTQ